MSEGSTDKVFFRGLRPGKRVFALMALCAAALASLLCLGDALYRQRRDRLIGFQSGHLQIVPAGSPILAGIDSAASAPPGTDAGLPLLELDDSFHQWLVMQEEIEGVAPVIDGSLRDAAHGGEAAPEGEAAHGGEGVPRMTPLALPASAIFRVLPLVGVARGADDITWMPFMKEVPMLLRKGGNSRKGFGRAFSGESVAESAAGSTDGPLPRLGQTLSVRIAPFAVAGKAGNATPAGIIPARVDGLLEGASAYARYDFIDINAYRAYAGLSEDAATALIIRLRDINDTSAMKRLLRDRIRAMGSDAEVVDWEYLNRDALRAPTAAAAAVFVLIVAFAALLAIGFAGLALGFLGRLRRERPAAHS